MTIEQLSIDLSNYCSKGCPFCYNKSNTKGLVSWAPDEVIRFALDCIANGVKAISLGGGEPFEYDGIFEVIEALYPHCYLTVTSNGLPLEDDTTWTRLVSTSLDKLHLTIHSPGNSREVNRVLHRLALLKETGIKPGLNLLVGADTIESAKLVFAQALEILELDQIILIPQRYSNMPTPKELSKVAGGRPFQSPSCILQCQRPEGFCSVNWDKQVNFCSYAGGKVQLRTLDYKGLTEALQSIVWSTVDKC